MNKLLKEKLIAYFLVLIGVLVYGSLIFNHNVWLDEAFTASLIRTDFAGVLMRSMQDTLPPLYNILLKLATDLFGYSVPIMKVVSVIPMILTMLLGATTVRKRFGNIASYLFIICLFTMPYLLFYGVEIRMYSWGFFFATGSGIYAYEVIKDSNRKNWICFTLLSVGAGYTHHFAFVTVGFIYLFLLIYYLIFDRIHLKRWLICLSATFILYLPCLIITLQQLKRVSGYFSMPEVTLSVFIKYLRYPYTIGNPLLSIALALLMLLLLLRFAMNKNRQLLDWYSVCCFATYYGVLCFGTIISKIMTANIFVDRYLFFAFGLIWLFFAISVSSFHKNYLITVFAFLIIAGVVGYTKEWKLEYAEGLSTMQTFMDANFESRDKIVSYEEAAQIATCLEFYYPDICVCSAEELDQTPGNNWCIITEGYEANLNELERLGYSAEFQGDFRFDRYTFKLYLLTKTE
ncbi:MAG TPA: glycosyltransferase family 39 protein [Lachnospiraceae bacterium]|nr:glycosyltransferase family 39 protein [Lachnospiraceae bacterium]